MPNYYAHRAFGERVLSLLPEELRARLESQRPAFDLGCLGPDPLFFHRPATRNPARMEGFSTHEASALPAFLRLRAAVEGEVPMAEGYAAGFLCHLALDSGCHGWVNRRAAQGDLTHPAMEGEFDRFLMERDGLDPLAGDYMLPPPGAAACRAASAAYLRVTPEEMDRAYRTMARDTRLLARLAGSRTGRLLDRLCHRLPALRDGRGVILDAKPRPEYTESNRALEGLFLRAAPVAADQVERFFAAVASGGSLDPWLDRDFEGGVGREPQGAGRSAPAY